MWAGLWPLLFALAVVSTGTADYIFFYLCGQASPFAALRPLAAVTHPLGPRGSTWQATPIL